MNSYEIMCIFDPKITAPAETSEMVEGLLTSYGAEIEDKNDMGTKKLAYVIKKRHEGHYWLFNYKMPTGNIDALKKELHIKEALLRYLIVRREA